MYDAIKIIHNNNTTVDNLQMLRHPYNSRKNEALNRAFAKVAPKNIMFCKTHTLFDRLSLVICIDSLSYKNCLEWLFPIMFDNDDCVMDHVTQGWAVVQDRIKTYMHKQQKLFSEKIKHSAMKKIKLNKQCIQEYEAKKSGHGYGLGIALRGTTARNITVRITGRVRAKPTQCHCGATDHLRISFKGCKLNKNYVEPENQTVLPEAACMDTVVVLE